MTLKKRLTKRSNLYVILDRETVGGRSRMAGVADSALKAGADMLQLRSKRSSLADIARDARMLKRAAKRYNVPLIMNDRLDAAIATGCDGLHIGQGDIDISVARKLLPKDSIIGISVRSVREAKKAVRSGADYVGVGPVFRTPLKKSLKPRGVGLLCKLKKMGIPSFAIGGIETGNINTLRNNGLRRVAIIRAVCNARDPYKAALGIRKAIES